MWRKLSLRNRIFLLLALLLCTTFGGNLVMAVYSHQMNRLFSTLIDTDVASLHAADELQIALARQKGYVTYYYLYGDDKWLDELDKHHEAFKKWLYRARESALGESERRILNRIESDYMQYTFSRNQVIELYKAGRREAGALLHDDVRGRYSGIMQLCDEYKANHEHAIAQARSRSVKKARFIRVMAVAAVIGVFVFGAVLAFVLVRQILSPIRRLAMEGETERREAEVPDEVWALSQRVHSLIENVDETKNRLEQSQEHLLQAEKWALVGKLAAGMAHSIRNPLTSVKMRLFSIGRTARLTDTEKEDFEVISEEIGHVDTIVQNFLEFSRPPKLKMQEASPSDVVDVSLRLVRHRLESNGVTVTLRRHGRLPMVWLDPEQLKEAIANLLLNASEAMSNGGSVIITEATRVDDSGAEELVIEISDTGPGIPSSLRERVFQPFFSIKEDGTGLGLSIAKRIVEGHGGKLELLPDKGKGAAFAITLRRN